MTRNVAPGVAERWTVSAGRAAPTPSTCAPARAGRTATRWWRPTSWPACGAWWIRPPVPATRSTWTSSPTPPRIIAGTKPPCGTRGRQRRRSADRGRHAAHAGGLPADAAVAPEHLPGAPANARRQPAGLRQARRHGGQRGLRAQASGCRAPRSCSRATTTTGTMRRRSWTAVKYLLIPDENAELARYRGGELQVTFVVPRGQFDWVQANLRRPAARAPAAGDLLLRLQPAPRRRSATARSCAARSPSSSTARSSPSGAARGRAARLRLDAAGDRQLHLAVLRLHATCRMPERIARGAAPVRAGRLLAGQAACRSSCATTPAKCTPSLRWRSPPCGRRPSAPTCTWSQVEFKSLLQDIDRAMSRCSAPAGSATTTMPTPSRST